MHHRRGCEEDKFIVSFCVELAAQAKVTVMATELWSGNSG